MVLHVKVLNNGDLYKAASEGVMQENLASFRELGPGLVDTETLMRARQRRFTLETTIRLAEGDETKLPYEQLSGSLTPEEFQVEVAGPRQVILEHATGTYTMAYQSQQHFGNTLSLTTRQLLTNTTRFNRSLATYATLLQTLLNSLVPQEEHDIEYRIGEYFEHTAREQSEEGSQPMHRSLDQLERHLLLVPSVSFADIGGNLEGKALMQQIYDDIVMPDRARIFGRDPERQRGYLLIGGAGYGKTMLVSALANKLMTTEAKIAPISFYFIGYEDVTSEFRGGEARGMSQIFKLVQRNLDAGIRSALFFDELHLIGKRLKSEHTGNEALDTLLAHLDGARRYNGLITIGASHLPVAELDPALVRRFPIRVELPLPDAEARRAILNIYLDKYQRLASDGGNGRLFDLDLDRVVEESEGLTGDDLSTIFERASITKQITLVDGREEVEVNQLLEEFTPITTEDFLAAADRHQSSKTGNQRE